MSTKKIKKTELILLPDNFDLEQHIVQYPLIKNGFYSSMKFNKEKIYYFLGLLTNIPARNQDIVTEDGFVPINQKIIRDGIKDIKDYIDYLVNTEVIECDNYYIPNEKSFGYKWAEKYSLSKFSVKQLECKYIDFDTQKYAWQYEKYPYLFHWYQQNKLMIDDATEDYAFELYQDKINDTTKESWDFNNKGERKHPKTQYNSAILNIAKIKECCYEAHIDDNVHRLHSAFTGLGKKYRKFVTYNGKKLAGIDIKNSQPYIACLILNKDFWNFGTKHSSLPLNLKSLPDDIYINLITPRESSELIKEYFKNVKETDITKYINMVSSGLFYDKIAEIVNELGFGNPIGREEAKVFMFHTFYSSNKQPNELFLRQMRGIFKDLFPKVAEFFKIIKHEYKIFKEDKELRKAYPKQYNKLACLLQSIESEIVLHKCCKRIWEEGNQKVPVFTIHDSIITTQDNEDFVKKIMEEELKKHIGIAPLFSSEKWE